MKTTVLCKANKKTSDEKHTTTPKVYAYIKTSQSLESNTHYLGYSQYLWVLEMHDKKHATSRAARCRWINGKENGSWKRLRRDLVNVY